MFKKNKVKQVKEDLSDDVKIVLPSCKVFLACYLVNLRTISARLDSKNVLKVDESVRVQSLIENFNEIASEALVQTLIETGYKREPKRKWKLKWLSLL